MTALHGAEEKLSALDFTSGLLTKTHLDLPLLLDEIVRVTTETMHARACAIRLLDKDSGEMVLKASSGLSEEYLHTNPLTAASSIFRQFAAGNHEPIAVLDIAKDPRTDYVREAAGEGIHSFLSAPLVQDGEAIGTLSMFAAGPHDFTPDERRLFSTMANQASVAISLARLYKEQLALRQIEHELEIAAGIQRKLMPETAPSIPPFDIAGACHPCYEIGGDFFDFIELPGGNLGIVEGDVSGKGVPAALLMATIRSALRVQAENIFSMQDVLRKVNRAVWEDTNPEEFVTLFYGVLDTQAGVLTYINAGHNPGLLVRDGTVTQLTPANPPIGILPDLLPEQETLQLHKGDVLAICTDGYSDTEGTDGEPLGEEGVAETLRLHAGLPARAIIEKLEETVEIFQPDPTAAYCDDRTAIVAKR